MKDERIDNYVMGKMSDKESIAFEHELLNNPELQHEVALHQEIVLAIQMKGAKEYALNIRMRRNRTWIIRLTSCVAVAACLAVGIFFHTYQTSNYKTAGYQLELTGGTASRGGFNADDIIARIESQEYRAALELIAEEQSQLSADDPLDVIDNDELEWYKTVTYMRMGKWIKARKLLKHIAASDSYYKSQAQSALEQL